MEELVSCGTGLELTEEAPAVVDAGEWVADLESCPQKLE